MKKIKEIISSPKGTAVLFAAAIALLLGSTVGGARAAVLYGQETAPRTIETAQLNVVLVEENDGTEGGRVIDMPADGAGAELLEGMVPENAKVQPGKRYTEKLGVRNNGGTAEYVRVTVWRYWAKADGDGTVKEKIRTIRPDYIGLNFLTEGSGWVVDTEASAKDWSTDKTFAERIVLYYTRPLASGETVYFADGLTVDERINDALRAQDGLLADGEGIKFQVKVCVDAVQTHNGEDAVLSAWGRTVSIDDSGNLSLTERERGGEVE